MPIQIGPLSRSLRSILRDLRDIPIIVNEAAPALTQVRADLDLTTRSSASAREAVSEAATSSRRAVADLAAQASTVEGVAAAVSRGASSARRDVDGLSARIQTAESDARGRLSSIADAVLDMESRVGGSSTKAVESVRAAEREIQSSTERIYARAEDIGQATLAQLQSLITGLREGSAGVGQALDFLQSKTGNYIDTLRTLVEAILAGQRPLEELRLLVQSLESSLGRNSPLTQFADEILGELEYQYNAQG